MKKIYILTASLFLAGAVSAQTEIIKDGGFQGTYVNGAQVGQTSPNIGGFTTNMTSLDWFGIVKAETVAPITGTQSAVMISVEDAVAADSIGSSEPKTSGFIQQLYSGTALAGKTPSDFTFSFKYKYEPVGADTAFVLVNIMDATLGNTSAAIMYQGLALFAGTTSTATLRTVNTWGNGPAAATGTANRVVIVAASSMENYFDDLPANVGSKFTLDDMSLKTIAPVGLNEITASSNVYPNPVNDVLNVEISNAEATSISIYTLSGALVQTTELNGVKGSVNVSELKTGMYLYTISTKGGATIQSKFLKK